MPRPNPCQQQAPAPDSQRQPGAGGARAPPRPQAVVRRYSPQRDHADVVHICANVYGGSDDLPATINASAAQPGSHILVASTGGQEGRLDALLCCQRRGDVLWLWGARTREELRGRGLARLLMAEAEALGRSLEGVAALCTVTIPSNATMLRLLASHGFVQQREVVRLPARDPGEVPPLALLPQVENEAGSTAPRQLLPHWRRCASIEELSATLRRLRQHSGLHEPGPLATWLPGEYELVPAAWTTVQQLIERGSVWLLHADDPAGTSDAALQGSTAALVFWGAGHGGVRHAGVVAGCRGSLEAALLHAAAADPGCRRFYVDCCARRGPAELWGSTGACGERYDILPFLKRL